MSMYSTKMSLGRWRGVGAKLMMLLTPARTSVSATSCALSVGTVRTAICTPRSRTISSMRAASKQRQPCTVVFGDAGSTSKAATMATDGLLSAKCGKHRTAEVADADQRDVLAHGAVQKAADAVDAGVDVVALVGAAASSRSP